MDYVKRAWLPVSILGMVLLVLLVNWRDSSFSWVWIYRWTLLEGLLTLYVALGLCRAFSWPLGLLFGYLALNALVYSSFNVHTMLDRKVQQGLRLAAAMEHPIIILFPVILLTCGRRFWEWSLLALRLAAWGLSIGALFAPDPTMIVPITWNPSITGSFVAVMLVGMRCPVAFLVLGAALVEMRSMTPFAILALGLAPRLFSYWNDWVEWVKRLFFSFAIGGGCIYAYSVSGAKLEDGNGRFNCWRIIWGWIREQDSILQAFGTGVGSTAIITPLLQLARGYNPKVMHFYVYLHQDWLQIILESGFVGFALALLFFLDTVRRSDFFEELTGPMVLGYGVAMMTNFPLHQPLLAMTGLVIIGSVYAGKRTGLV